MLLACLIAAATVGGAASIASGATTAPPRASLQDPICMKASDSLDRLVAITAVMRPLNATQHMELQFNLFEKLHRASAYSKVIAGDLGKWVSPGNPTLGQRPGDVWERQKQVVNLAGPAVYRFHVGFRWIGAHDQTLGTEYHWGPVCQQP
jgi:hypothetical protein